jgi:hypothetical protein
LNRVPFGKFNRVNVLIRGGLSAMRDVAFLVRLPEGATGIQRSRHFLEGLLPEDEIRSQEKQTRKEISSVMQGNLCGGQTAAVVLRAMAGQGSSASLSRA